MRYALLIAAVTAGSAIACSQKASSPESHDSESVSRNADTATGTDRENPSDTSIFDFVPPPDGGAREPETEFEIPTDYELQDCTGEVVFPDPVMEHTVRVSINFNIYHKTSRYSGDITGELLEEVDNFYSPSARKIQFLGGAECLTRATRINPNIAHLQWPKTLSLAPAHAICVRTRIFWTPCRVHCTFAQKNLRAATSGALWRVCAHCRYATLGLTFGTKLSPTFNTFRT